MTDARCHPEVNSAVLGGGTGPLPLGPFINQRNGTLASPILPILLFPPRPLAIMAFPRAELGCMHSCPRPSQGWHSTKALSKQDQRPVGLSQCTSNICIVVPWCCHSTKATAGQPTIHHQQVLSEGGMSMAWKTCGGALLGYVLGNDLPQGARMLILKLRERETKTG